MDKKQELIKQCKYYKGEEDNPFDDGLLRWFWDMERVYVQTNGDMKGEDGYYKLFVKKHYPNIPYPLILNMFTSWGKYTYSIKDSIEDFYKVVDNYLLMVNISPSEDQASNQ